MSSPAQTADLLTWPTPHPSPQRPASAAPLRAALLGALLLGCNPPPPGPADLGAQPGDDLAAPPPDLAAAPDLPAAADLRPPPAGELDIDTLRSYPTGSHYAGVPFALGDLDGDGNPDAVMPLQNDSQVAVLLADGKGGLRPVTTVAADGANMAALADLNGDGKLDLVVTMNGRATNPLQTLLGRGDGTFAAARPSGPNGPWYTQPLLRDLTGDGKVDVVLASSGIRAAYLVQGLGDGTFAAAAQALPLGVDARTLRLADVNGDGRPDLVGVSDRGDDASLAVLLNQGGGAFAAAARYTPTPGGRLYGAAPLDCDGDGRDDLIVAADDGATVLRGSATGALSAAGRPTTAAATGGVTTGDWNRDGKPDLVTVDKDLGTFAVHLGRGDCAFSAPRLYHGGYGAREPLAADLDGDGALEILLSDGAIAVARGRGDGTFRSGLVTLASGALRGVAAADFDRDGKLDLAVSPTGSRGPLLLPGRGDGTFAAPRTLDLGAEPGSLSAADLNGDGAPDLVVSAGGKVASLLGDGKGAFAPPLLATGGGLLLVGDLSGDGKQDVLAVGFDALVPLQGDGTGALVPRAARAAGGSLRDAVLADVNGDGRADAAWILAGGQAAFVALGGADGTLGAPATFAVARPTALLRAVDLDEDGRRDLVIGHEGGALSLLSGKGDGTFAAARTVPSEIGSPYRTDWVLEDLDGDGHRDSALFSDGNSLLELARGGGPAQLLPRRRFVLEFPEQLLAADVNGDGRPDLVTTTRQGTGALRILLNATR